MKRQQRGGTIIGFILGVLVGLGGALAVAVYVTKVPIPFVNKNQANSPELDAAEARKNRDWDPNAALAGKNPARAASAPSAGVVPAPPAAATPAAPAVAGGPGTAPAAARPAAADPLGDLARAKAGTAAPSGPAVAAAPAAALPGGPDPFMYFVQAGAFRTTEDAESQRAKLSLMGIEAKVTEREQAGRTVYRVRAGPFERKEDADGMKTRLESGGLEAALVRVQR